ncbi:restriction endonuclease subunit S [Streptococcus suis]|uniref:restriction endonuclease subunit S n=1 Tax=Streptococcus suis TaxID=1307 RepID=UPI000CF6AD2D|nr:restriction endonuclease subunit S [Streptococcus suis]
MKTNNNIPAYRFQGYTDAWELRKLGEVAPLRGGFAFKSSDFVKEGIPIVRISNILSNGRVGAEFVHYKELEQDERFTLHDGAAVLAMSGATTGKVSVLHVDEGEKYYQNQRVGYFTPTPEYNYDFIKVIVNSTFFTTQLSSVLVAGAQPNISSKEVDDFCFAFPKSLPEQEAIGTFFSTLDRQITLHQRKLDTLKEQKKTYLKLLFPAKGQTKPALRFQGFEDDWEEVKLGEVAEKFDNLRVPITASKRISGKTPYYGANGIQDYVEGYTHEGEFILIAEDGANDLKDYPVQYVNGKVWVNNHAHVIQSVRNFASNLFLLRALKTIDIEMYLVGGGRAKLNGDVMMKLPFKIPTLPEQEVIGTFFQTLDQELTLVEDKLASLKEMKKTLLRKLFV